MKLYVCFDALKKVRATPRPGGHPCGNAYHALTEAGHDFEVESVGGLGMIPILNSTSGRKKVKELSGSPMVPVLVTDDGKVISDSKRIIEWAGANPSA
jgi:hypothetical protein